MKTISIEFCLSTLLLLFIFILNILHILYLIIYKHNKQIQSIRFILINSSFSSLIVSIWLIPFFYFRTIWSSDSFSWRLWSFIFHIVDAVQLYSLLLIITTRSFQRIFICFIWLAPIIAYSPLLWLTSPYDRIDYLPYRRLSTNVPCIIPLIYYCYKKEKNLFVHQHNNEHHKDMTELTNLIKTVFNFQLEQPINKPNTFNTWISSFYNPITNRLDQSLVSSYEPYFLFDELSSSPLIHSSITQTEDYIEQPFNSCLLFIITCLLLLVHLPYVLFSILDMSSLQLSTFIYLHWFGTLFIPMIHIK